MNYHIICIRGEFFIFFGAVIHINSTNRFLGLLNSFDGLELVDHILLEDPLNFRTWIRRDGLPRTLCSLMNEDRCCPLMIERRSGQTEMTFSEKKDFSARTRYLVPHLLLCVLFSLVSSPDFRSLHSTLGLIVFQVSLSVLTTLS